MGPRTSLITFLPSIPILLVHLTGVIAAIVLLFRKKGSASILALVGFALLFLLDVASFGRAPLAGLLGDQLGIEQYIVANAGIGCCCSVFDVAAIVCLVMAIWQAVTGGAASTTIATGEGAGSDS